MNFRTELKQIIYDLPFGKIQPSREEVAHFCEHYGISIQFSRARTTWRALLPSTLKPWWLTLEPIKEIKQKT